MKPDYSRIPRHTLKTLEAWIATGRHLDDDNDADAFCRAIVMNDLEAAMRTPMKPTSRPYRRSCTGCSIMRRGAAMEARPRWAPGPGLRACTPAARSDMPSGYGDLSHLALDTGLDPDGCARAWRG